jgi:hypothetical protein
MKKKVLIIGPFPKPVTGNAIANKVVFKLLDDQPTVEAEKIDMSYNIFKENIGKFSLKKALFFLQQLSKDIKLLIMTFYI